MQDISKIGKRSSTTNSFSNSISGSFSKSNSTATNSISITSKLTNFKQENERKLIDRYPFLDDPKQLRTYYGSFDNHPNEYYMVDFWKDLLEFMYKSSFNCFAAKLEEIYDLTKIKGKKPIGLPNIIKKFNADNIFVFQKDLLSDEYFQKYHPDVIPKASMIGSIVGSIGSNLYSYFSSYIYKPTDIEPNLEDILINIKLFKLYCNEILEHIELISRETDSQVITLISLLNNISYLTEKNVEICLQYMHKLKKLIYFTTKIDSRDIKCIKYLNGNYEDAKIEDKDTVILNLQHSIDKLDRKENEIHEVMEDLTIKIKENLIKNQRDKAKNILKKKKLYEAKYNEYCNMKLTLEKNLLDIKSNEGNQMTKISLQESIKTIKELQLQNKEFDQVFDIMRNNREDLQDITNTVKDFNKFMKNIY